MLYWPFIVIYYTFTAAYELDVGPYPGIFLPEGLAPCLLDEYSLGEVWNLEEPCRSLGAGVDVPPFVINSESSKADGVLGTGTRLGC